MSIIEIKYLFDEHDCETCGGDWATGYAVKIDGKSFGEYEPIAHCFNGRSYEIENVLSDIIKSFGHTIEVTE